MKYLTLKPELPTADIAALQKNLDALTNATHPKSYYPPTGTAEKVILNAVIGQMKNKDINALFLQAAQAESMLGHLRDFKAFIEANGTFDYDVLAAPQRLHPKRKTEFMDEMLTVHKRMLRRMIEFETVNKVWVQMLNRLTAGTQEDFNTLEEKIYDNVIQAYNTKHLQVSTYLKQGTSSEAYYSSPIELCRQLAQLSNGALYLTPQQLAKHLTEAGFKEKTGAYYVELVK